jgi:hypothetical protein
MISYHIKTLADKDLATIMDKRASTSENESENLQDNDMAPRTSGPSPS